ncbi:MAG: sulfatase [Planctomycetota bacterium]
MASLAACGSSDPPVWTHLADGHDPATNERLESEEGARVARAAGWYEWRPNAAVFSPLPTFERVLETQRPFAPEGLDADGRADEFWVAGRAWPLFDGEAFLAASDPRAFLREERERLGDSGAYFAAGDKLLVLLGSDSRLEDVVYRTSFDRGQRLDGRWQTALGRYGGEGLSVLPGERARTRFAAPAEAKLRFATVARGGRGGEVVFSVTQNGVELFRHVETPALPPRVARHTLAVQPGELIFAVTGSPAQTAFLNPIVGPRDVGTYRERPWGADRPDLVVFLADTFRADNLAAYGGEGLETPHLARSLAEAQLFERAWSPSSWTLPAHASLFTGLFPFQHGAISHGTALSAEAVTLAEHLAAAGYRAGAVTDAGYVTRAAGLAQGFEWFDESWGTLDDSLAQARAFLDADDGRPVFLFLQTYRTHTPYEVDEGQRAELSQRLDLSQPFAAVQAAVFEGGGWDPVRDPAAHNPDDLARYRALYRASVAGLDAGWNAFQRDLTSRGLLDSGTLLFTSDHGEALWENQRIGHGNSVFQPIVHVPFALFGHGIEPGRTTFGVSLVDVPKTFSALAGLAPDPQWLGRDVLALDADVPLFAWENNHRDQPSSRARLSGTRKWIFEQETDVLELAYDLGVDPEETDDLSAAEWARTGAPPALDELELLEAPRIGAGRADFGPEAEARLRELGYLGED